MQSLDHNPYAHAIAAFKPAPMQAYFNENYIVTNGVRFPGLRLLQPLLETRHGNVSQPPPPPVLKPMPVVAQKQIAKSSKKKKAPGGSARKKRSCRPALKSVAELCDELADKLAKVQEQNVTDIAEKKRQSLAKTRQEKLLVAKSIFELLPSGALEILCIA